MKNLLMILSLSLSIASNASTTMKEATAFISTLDSHQNLKGPEGCEDIKIMNSPFSASNYFLNIGKGSTIHILHPYTLKSTRVDATRYEFEETVRRGGFLNPYPYQETEIVLVKESSSQLSSLKYSYVVKQSPFNTTEKVQIKCMR